MQHKRTVSLVFVSVRNYGRARTGELSLIFLALADQTRRFLLEQLQPGEATVSELTAPHSISVPSVSGHLKVLKQVGLSTRSRSAPWRGCRRQPAPLEKVEEWMGSYRDFLSTQLNRLDAQLYATPDRPDALTEPEDR